MHTNMNLDPIAEFQSLRICMYKKVKFISYEFVCFVLVNNHTSLYHQRPRKPMAVNIFTVS